MFVDIVFLDLLVFVFVFDCEVTYSENMVTVVVVVLLEKNNIVVESRERILILVDKQSIQAM